MLLALSKGNLPVTGGWPSSSASNAGSDLTPWHHLNTLRPRQDGRYFADGIFKCIFLKEDIWISINIWLKFVSKGPINNIPALVQIMAWRRPGDKPSSKAMMVSLLMNIWVIRRQWVNMSSVTYIWPDILTDGPSTKNCQRSVIYYGAQKFQQSL